MVVDHNFHRKYIHNDVFFKSLHSGIFLDKFRQETGLKIKPSYCLLSSYEKDLGICPPHRDRPQCYITLNLCLNQAKVWPLFVAKNSFPSHRSVATLHKHELEEKVEILLNPGDGVAYSGIDYLHWREKISNDNFCDMLHLHFVPEDFQGDLD